MIGPWLGPLLVLAGATAAGDQLDLDCARPAAARTLVGRLMLSEIEGAEDINRAAMWDAFGRCPPGPSRRDCVAREQSRFEAAWDEEKRRIESKYRRILDEFEARCQA